MTEPIAALYAGMDARLGVSMAHPRARNKRRPFFDGCTIAFARLSGVIAKAHFKGLGEHVLEMAGWTRRVGSGRPREINKKLSGSGGVHR